MKNIGMIGNWNRLYTLARGEWVVMLHDDDLLYNDYLSILFNKYIDIFTVDQRKERLCGQEKMDKADFFIQRTFYNEAPKLVKNFSDVKYTCGYGIILKHESLTGETIYYDRNLTIFSEEKIIQALRKEG